MEYLPPTGWSDVARKQDVDNQRLSSDKEFAIVRSEMSIMKAELIANMEKRFNQQTKWILTFMTAQLMTMVSLVATLAIKL